MCYTNLGKHLFLGVRPLLRTSWTISLCISNTFLIITLTYETCYFAVQKLRQSSMSEFNVRTMTVSVVLHRYYLYPSASYRISDWWNLASREFDGCVVIFKNISIYVLISWQYHFTRFPPPPLLLWQIVRARITWNVTRKEELT